MQALTIEQAERLHGARLDRRRRYATTDDGEPCDITGSYVFEITRWSQPCSGCYSEACLMHMRGSGCVECGYTGRRQNAQWVPVSNRLAKHQLQEIV